MNQKAVLDTMNLALASARGIATSAKADPGKFVRPEIENWRINYVASRLYGSANPGYFDRLRDSVAKELEEMQPGILLLTLGPWDLSGQATGESEGSDAVLKYISWLAAVVENVERSFMPAWTKALDDQNVSAIKDLYENGVLQWQKYFQCLYNTMSGKMAQGDRPSPVPGPDEEIIMTPFGPKIVKRSGRKLADLTVDEFRAILSQMLNAR